MAVAEVTVKQLAKAVGIPVERLLGQLSEAGLDIHDADQAISEDQKRTFLEFLRKSQMATSSKRTATTAAPKSDKKITLKRKEVSTLKVSSDSGKRKTVNIEVRKKRTYLKPGVEEEIQPVEEEAPLEFESNKVEEPKKSTPKPESEEVLPQEVDAVTEADETSLEEVDSEKLAELQAAAQTAEDKTAKAKKGDKSAETKHKVIKDVEPSEDETARKKKLASRKTQQAPKHLDKKTIMEALDETTEDSVIEAEEIVETKVKAPIKPQIIPQVARPQLKSKLLKKHTFTMPKAPQVYEVTIPSTITVAELAKRMSLKAPQVIKVLMGLGVMASINQPIEQDTAILVVEELGHKPVTVSESAIEERLLQQLSNEDEPRVHRAPVVTIMGHVDHGKTSLLDYIRRTKVAAGEAGGITQHIGAYHVSTPTGEITFLDTPGHEAFTAMRARGAQTTDVVVLVVAADDGVKPQTQEAIQHAKAAGVPLIVALNKIDKPEADPDRVKHELSNYEVIPEDWGGDTQFIPISALTGDGVDELLDAINVQSEMLELTARAEGNAEGIVLESRLDKGRGVVATILVRQGQLKKGDIVLAGSVFGRVRAMLDESGQPVAVAGPSIPVQLLGLSEVPKAGDEAIVVQSERQAREVAQHRLQKRKEEKVSRLSANVSLENLFDNLQQAERKELNIVLKADVQGSVEAIINALEKINNDEVAVKVVASGVGGITESDVTLAMASKAILFGFNVRADNTAKALVERESVDLHYYSVIYDIVDEVKQALSGMLSPEIREEIIGTAEVRDVFKSPKFGAVAGCMVVDGIVKRSNPIRVLRDNVVIYEGVLESLRRFKEDAAEVRQGYECGIAVKNYNDVKPGDQIEVYQRTEHKREIV